MRKYLISPILLTVIILLNGCGGGSEAEIPTPIPDIVVSANIDLSVNEQTQVSIEGAASGGDGELTYSWQGADQVQIEHPDTALANATLTTPVVTETQIYTVTLLVTDASGNTGSDSFALTVLPVNTPPTAVITANNLQNYQTQTYPVNAEITLDASGSFDDDAVAGEPAIIAYQWQQIAGTFLLQGVAVDTAQLLLTSPVSDQSETIIFEVEVTDQEGATNSTQISITTLSQSQTLPEISIVNAHGGAAGENVFLESLAVSLAPDAKPFTYQWQERSGNFAGLVIQDPTLASTQITLPEVTETTHITFDVNAIDTFGNQVSAEATISVSPFPLIGINDTGALMAPLTQSSIVGQDADHGRDKAFSSGTLSKVGQGLAGFDFTKLNQNGDPISAVSTAWDCVRDNLTGLVWEIKDTDASSLHYVSQQFSWYKNDSSGTFGVVNEASTACGLVSQNCNIDEYVNQVNTVGLCGFFDWRIPTHIELQSLLHYGTTQNPKVDTDFFPNWGAPVDGQLWYWTNQLSADGVVEGNVNNAWALDLYSGIDNFLNHSELNYIRLVRAGRSGQ